MVRVALAGLALLAAIAAVLAWLLAPGDPLPARFAAADCGRVELRDARTGRPISGAEDLALAPDGMLIVSAHDRTDPALPDGGLWAVDLAELPPDGAATARPLLEPRVGVRFRPHGIALSPDGRRLALINRIAEDDALIEIGPLASNGWVPDRQLEDPRLCRANDLAFAGQADTLEITLDRADCATSLYDLWPGGTGTVLRAEGGRLELVRTGLSFPNGILDGHVAETRADRLLRPDGTAIALPGGPDNLSAAPDGIVAALHPNLLRIWLHLQGWMDRAPSRIVHVEPASGAVEMLYDDPRGRFSAATSAVLASGRLVAGSVRDAGLLVCEPG